MNKVGFFNYISVNWLSRIMAKAAKVKEHDLKDLYMRRIFNEVSWEFLKFRELRIFGFVPGTSVSDPV